MLRAVSAEVRAYISIGSFVLLHGLPCAIAPMPNGEQTPNKIATLECNEVGSCPQVHIYRALQLGSTFAHSANESSGSLGLRWTGKANMLAWMSPDLLVFAGRDSSNRPILAQLQVVAGKPVVVWRTIHRPADATAIACNIESERLCIAEPDVVVLFDTAFNQVGYYSPGSKVGEWTPGQVLLLGGDLLLLLTTGEPAPEGSTHQRSS